MIELNQQLFIGEGKDKRVFIHPEEPSKCIKILKNKTGALKRIKQEIKVYSHLSRKGIQPTYVSLYLGSVNTNMGTGYIYNYIKPSPKSIDSLRPEDLRMKLNDIRRKLISDCVILYDINLDNFVMDESEHFHIVDGLGATEFIPICYWSKYFARSKVKRKFEVLMKSLEERTSGWTKPL